MNEIKQRIKALTPEQRHALRHRLVNSRPEYTIPTLPRDGRDFPLSFSQERLWFLDQLAPGSPFYNISIAQRLSFLPVVIHLESALASVVERHEALRTVFPQVDGQPVQRILPPPAIRCEVHDLQHHAEAEKRAAEIAAIVSQKPFHLAHGPLLRLGLVLLPANESLLLLVIHHIVADGWSLEKLLAELGQSYGDLATGQVPRYSPPLVQYADFAVWQRKEMSGEVLERHRAYWVNQLTGLPQLALQTDHPRPIQPSYRGARKMLTISSGNLATADNLARRLKTTRFAVLLTVFGALLHRLSNQDEIVIGTPMAARPLPELENVVGFFANTVVLRLDFGGACSLEEAVKRTHMRLREAQDHQDMPFSMVVTALAPEQDLSRNPLFQVSFQILSSSHVRSVETSVAKAVDFERGTSAFDFTLQLSETASGLGGQLEYSTDLFEDTTASAFVRRFLMLLEGALANTATPLVSLPLIDDAELQLLHAWSKGLTLANSSLGLCELFERQVEMTPNAVACAGPDGSLTYAELDAGANGLAQRLLQCGVLRGESVGVSLESSRHLPMALLAVLKAGAAYVPIDPELPAERTCGMLSDAGARLLISRPDHEAAFDAAITSIVVDRHSPPPIANSPKIKQDPESPAYVLFTSGSTGRPKGVVIPHRALLNYLHWCLSVYPVQQGDGAVLCTSFSSDMSVTTLFVPLLSGKTVFLLSPGGGLDALDAALRNGRQYSFLKLTPSHLEGLRQLAGNRPPPCSVACVIVGGEAFFGETLAPWRKDMPELLVVNEYGPTETTVGCCAHFARAGDIGLGPVPIGRPIANTRLFVCDSTGARVPTGVVGELHIGGAGVALGYAGQQALTSERFVSGPEHSIVYRSGDLVRYRTDGTLEYLGRIDRQVKVRGYRVEPGEIEAALRSAPIVADVAVVLHREAPGDDRLLAAVSLISDPEIIEDGLPDMLRQHLRERLPHHMIPTVFQRVDSIPLTTSGKVDHLRLRRMLNHAPAARKHIAPSTALENMIIRVFSDILKVDDVGATDDFFADLGGHSLLATRLVSQVGELLKVELPLRVVFEARCPREIARVVAPDELSRQRLESTASIILQVLEMSEADVERQLKM